MKYVIGKKQSAQNSDFVNAWQIIDQLVSKEEAIKLVNDAVVDITNQAKNKRVGYAWSGGKDSLALQYICEQAGISKCVLGISGPIEYPAFMEWVNANKPEKLQIWDACIDINYVVDHPEMLFPADSSKAAKWFSLIQHKAQAWFFKKEDLDIIVLGRRVQDGNYTGGAGKNIYTDKKGVTRLSPIAHWKHEEVLAVIHYFMNRNIPPIYSDPNGWIVGTGVWPARQWTKGIENGWKELYTVDRNIVIEASKKIVSAKEFLNSIK